MIKPAAETRAKGVTLGGYKATAESKAQLKRTRESARKHNLKKYSDPVQMKALKKKHYDASKTSYRAGMMRMTTNRNVTVPLY